MVERLTYRCVRCKAVHDNVEVSDRRAHCHVCLTENFLAMSPLGVLSSLTCDNGAFISGIGTVRPCNDCGVLIAGGPTRCLLCARERELATEPDWIFEIGQRVFDRYAPSQIGLVVERRLGRPHTGNGPFKQRYRIRWDRGLNQDPRESELPVNSLAGV